MTSASKVVAVMFGAALMTMTAATVVPKTADAEVLTCRSTETMVTFLNPLILDAINDEVAGMSFKISSRKTLIVNSVLEVTADGCEIRAVADVTLKRKWRRDAHGTVTAKGTITLDQLAPRSFDIEFDDVRVTSVNVSHTGILGEWAYKKIANMVLPDYLTFHIDF